MIRVRNFVKALRPEKYFQVLILLQRPMIAIHVFQKNTAPAGRQYGPLFRVVAYEELGINI